MMKVLLAVERMKMKRKGFWLLTVLGPFGVVAMQMVNYGVRKDWLFEQSNDDWGYYLANVHSFTPLALMLGITILTSLMTSVENETNAWKQLLALPVSKGKVYFAKFITLAFLLLISSMLLFVFALAYGIFLDLGNDIAIQVLIEISFYPYFAALPLLALQLWIATVSQNQGIPITTGVLLTILVLSPNWPIWVFWSWPMLMNDWNEPLINAGLGVAAGFLLYLTGMLDFMRRDVK